MFVFLTDVPEELGPPHLVSQRHTADLPANPNFYPRTAGMEPSVPTRPSCLDLSTRTR